MAIIYGTNQSDSNLEGTPDADIIYGWAGSNLTGDEGPTTDGDYITVFTGDKVFGGAGRDQLFGRGENFTLDGGADDDYISILGGGNGDGVFIDGGTGVDWLQLGIKSTFGQIITLSIANGSHQQTLSNGLVIVGIEQIDFVGGDQDDHITGGDFADRMNGQYGDNIFYGGKGDDDLETTTGNDIIYGGDGNDAINGGWGNDRVYGDSGDDRITLHAFSVGTIVDGGSGDDILMFGRSLGVNIEVGDPLSLHIFEDGTSFIGIESFWFTGSGQNDRVIGGALFDYLTGGWGDDWLEGGGGEDTLFGGNGVDTVSYASSKEGINIDLSSAFGNTSGGDAQGDAVFEGFENVFGSNAQDHIIGSVVANELTGNGGDDFLTGAAGDDNLLGGEGIDTAIFAGNFANFTNYFNSATSTLYMSSTAEGTDTLTSIETFQFADGTKTFSEMVAASSAVQGASISATTAFVTEGNSGKTQMIFSILLTSPLATEQSVRYSIAGSGINPVTSDDISGALSGVVTFAPGDRARSVTLEVNGDLKVEADENITVIISDPSAGITIDVASATATIVSDDLFNLINGTAANDRYEGTTDADHIYGFAGDDALVGMSGNDELYGGQGNDVMVGGRGADKIDGGAALAGETKRDTLVYTLEVDRLGGFQGVIVNLSAIDQDGQAAGTATDTFGTIDTLSNIDNVYGTAFGDTFYFNERSIDESTAILGLGGNDTFIGSSGADLVRYDRDADLGGIAGRGIVANLTGAAISTITGTVSAKTIIDGFGSSDSVTSIESVRGTAFADVIYGGTADEFFITLNGNDFIDGGAGIDTVSYRRDFNYDGGSNGVIVNLSSSAIKVGKVKLAAGQAKDSFGAIDTLSNVEIVYGTDKNDTIYAANAGTEIRAEDGKDTLIGGAGKDLLDGGLGADKLTGKAGDDIYIVDNAGDKVTEKKSQGTDTIEASLASYSISKLSAVENLTYTGISNFIGTGNSGANKISGNVGDDKLDGGKGNDVLVGNAGNDTLTGGKNNDQFVFDKVLAGDDVIMDFVGGIGLVDQVVLDDSLSFASAAAAVAALVVQGADKVLNFADGSSITFKGQANLVFATDDFMII